MCKKNKKMTDKMDPERERKVKRIKKLAAEIRKSWIMEWYFND